MTDIHFGVYIGDVDLILVTLEGSQMPNKDPVDTYMETPDGQFIKNPSVPSSQRIDLTPLKELLKVRRAKKFLKDVEQFENFLSFFIQAWREYKERQYKIFHFLDRDFVKRKVIKQTTFYDFMNWLEEREENV